MEDPVATSRSPSSGCHQPHTPDTESALTSIRGSPGLKAEPAPPQPRSNLARPLFKGKSRYNRDFTHRGAARNDPDDISLALRRAHLLGTAAVGPEEDIKEYIFEDKIEHLSQSMSHMANILTSRQPYKEPDIEAQPLGRKQHRGDAKYAEKIIHRSQKPAKCPSPSSQLGESLFASRKMMMAARDELLNKYAGKSWNAWDVGISHSTKRAHQRTSKPWTHDDEVFDPPGGKSKHWDIRPWNFQKTNESISDPIEAYPRQLRALGPVAGENQVSEGIKAARRAMREEKQREMEIRQAKRALQAAELQRQIRRSEAAQGRSHHHSPASGAPSRKPITVRERELAEREKEVLEQARVARQMLRSARQKARDAKKKSVEVCEQEIEDDVFRLTEDESHLTEDEEWPAKEKKE